MTDDDKRIIQDINDVIVSLPKEFEMEGETFRIYPVTLGKQYLLAPLYEQLGISNEIAQVDPTLEMMRVVEDKRDVVCRIISYSTFDKKEDLGDASVVLERADFFKKKGSIQDLTKLLLVIMRQDNIKEMQDYLGITKEHELIAKCSKARDKSSSLDFCGKSVFGSLIVPACEKLNLTPMQVIWGISYTLLRMLMSDAPVTVYLSDKERKRVHIPTDRSRINADTKEGMEQIKRMNWD